MPRSTRAPVIITAGLAVLLGACTSGATKSPVSSPTTATGAASQPSTGFSAIPEIVRQVEPSVVTILTDKGLGSGIIWSADGTIVTDDHVIAGANSVEVAFADGRRSPGRVVANDPITDIALMKTDRSGLPAATFSKGLPTVGELAVALGSPLGLENTVTAGIVSGLQRSVPGAGAQTQSLVDLIQTDAAISPGNSGGAVVDAHGEVIGMSEAYVPPSAGAVSIGFATPAPTVSDIVGQLLASGRAKHAYFGIEPTQVTPQIARDLGLGQMTGVAVLDVVAGGPADRAGIMPGDVLVALDGKAIDSVEAFLGALRPHAPGDVVTVTLLRNGSKQDVKVTVADRPSTG